MIDKKLEVGDTVKVTGDSLGGYKPGKIVRVVERPLHGLEIDDSKLYVTDKQGYDQYPIIHRVSELELIRKGEIK